VKGEEPVSYKAHGFVDGAYLRALAKKHRANLVNPRRLCENVVSQPVVQTWAASPVQSWNTVLSRVIYYDAQPPEAQDASPSLQSYWGAIELLPDTELGFGQVRGGSKKRPPRQKGVDTLIAVHMLVGAYTDVYSVAVLVSGDADFVPVVNEVRRRGVMVVLAAMEDGSLSDDLRRAADRFVPIGPRDGGSSAWFPELKVDEKTWTAE